jgi:ABC-type metal ion transport system substrate-binding protein
VFKGIYFLTVTRHGKPAGRFISRQIKVGIISGEDEDVWRVVVAQAAEKGLAIETVVFNDYTQPNEALERGEIDANAFQHQPYLDNQIKTQGYHIVPRRLHRRLADRPLLEEVHQGRRPARGRGHRRAERSFQ